MPQRPPLVSSLLLSTLNNMAGTPQSILRGAVPIDAAILDTINKLVDDLELLRSHVATATAVTPTTAAALLAYKLVG